MTFEELLETRNQGELAVVKSILESEGIPCFVQGEHSSGALPFGVEVRIMVPAERLEEARDLIRDLTFSVSPFQAPDATEDESS